MVVVIIPIPFAETSVVVFVLCVNSLVPILVDHGEVDEVLHKIRVHHHGEVENASQGIAWPRDKNPSRGFGIFCIGCDADALVVPRQVQQYLLQDYPISQRNHRSRHLDGVCFWRTWNFRAACRYRNQI